MMSHDEAKSRTSSARSINLLERGLSPSSYGTNQSDIESQLPTIAQAIERFKGQAPLGCCFTISPRRNACEYASTIFFGLATATLIVTGTLISSNPVLWCSLGPCAIQSIIGVVLAAHKQRMIPLLDDHKNMGNLLDFIYSSYIALRETVASLRASVERLDGHINQLNTEIFDLNKIKNTLEKRLDRLEKINDTLTASTASLQRMIQEGGEDFNELIAQAKEGQGAFWEKCLKLDEINEELKETSEAFELLESKLRNVVNNVLDYPEMQDFHRSIEKLSPLFPAILESAGKPKMSERESEALTSLITEIQEALSKLSEQDEKVASKLEETKRDLQACLAIHCRRRPTEETEEHNNDGGGSASP